MAQGGGGESRQDGCAGRNRCNRRCYRDGRGRLLLVLSTAGLAAVLSILTSLAGIPEAGDVPVTKLAKED